MARLLIAVALAVGFLNQWTSLPAAEHEREIVWPQIFVHTPAECARDEWRLGLIDGRLGFFGRADGSSDDGALPAVPVDNGMIRDAYILKKEGDTLRIEIREQQRDVKNQSEKDGWFLTGRYTDKGGDVILSKEESKYSHWRFMHVNDDLGTDVPQYQIKNINDLGKDAWLAMASKGIRYKGHEEFRQPKLSFDQKQIFAVEDARDGR
ncbi:MAG TPA: hypothetical protein VG056_13565 [Pirellulales bacterium]|jgi:hypothetical protein|nr:hypothetical protein [Pirellulales bacterium]